MPFVTDCSCFDSSSLLISQDAENATPVILKNIRSSRPNIVTLSDKYKNCCAAYSPRSHAALLVTRQGKLKLANLNLNEKFTICDLREKLDSSARRWWRFCSLQSSIDGRRACVLDTKGKLVIIDIKENLEPKN